ncbi:guanine deaminase [Pollutimonas harenae]|uniref:Guanine deaminase n=1 Tax=Pollutimonas harenae TaxID=657015 RepID=A0A853GYS3_9BURK|nr:guanine deaminase [Pollutimonas harenae]NYT84549.1 guanine deaminase [Pollutimonas harenae]TEA73644.1 guanine deaminase [Pollutimonas harenae]
MQPIGGAVRPDGKIAYRAQLLYFTASPEQIADGDATVYLPDGLLVVHDGHVAQIGDYQALAASLGADTSVVDWRGKLIMPGFIDTHLHYPQTDIIASPAEGLLPWLETYTFPEESRFQNSGHAARTAQFFLDELLRCGTTTALVYCTVHPESAEAFFEESHARQLRMVAGKVMMDRNCPDYLQDTAESGARDSEALIQRWHGKGRQMYALTPRFAPTSTPEQLGLCGELAQRYQDVFIQSHLAENTAEMEWVKQLFPDHRSYLDIYDHFGLLRRRAAYGHCIWLDETDRHRMAETGTLAVHCPTSNLFLGSGLFDFAAANAAGVPVGLGTDVGGGTSFSMLQTMAAAHNVARMSGHHLSAHTLFYLATEGAAQGLDLGGQIGTLAPGAEADFIVLDPQATPLLARRTARADSLEEMLFALLTLGDDRAVAATYAAGRLRHERSPSV